MQRTLHLLTFVLFLALPFSAIYAQSGQTRLYKRVLIVENGQKQTVNDDAHFITFNHKGLYVSNSEGVTTGEGLVDFVKNDGTYHCYKGRWRGVTSEIFFSNDYSRVNVKHGNKVEVYQREPGNKTTATLRSCGDRSTAGGSPVYVPTNPITSGNSGSSSGRSSTRRSCPLCHGSGKYGDDVVYRPDYTGKQLNEYCSVCGRTTTPHSHRTKTCNVCSGRGYVE